MSETLYSLPNTASSEGVLNHNDLREKRLQNQASLIELPGKAIRYTKFRLGQLQVKHERPNLIARAFARAEELGRMRAPGEKRALLLPTASPGNLGDDAVFRATVGELKASGYDFVTIISFREDERYDIPGAQTVVLPLHHNPGGDHYLTFVEELARYTHYFVWGADIVDGTHGIEVVMPRCITANLAARLGVKVHLCSFSVAQNRSQKAMELLRGLDPSVLIQCRDPISAQRLRSELPNRTVEVTADLAFMLISGHDAPLAKAAKAWADARRAEGKVLMGVNINDLFCSNFGIPKEDLLNAFARGLTGLHEAHPRIAFIYIPHDTHANKMLGKMTDFSLARELHALLPEMIRNDAFLPGEALSAPDVRAICSYLDLIFSSRMHLAIASLAVGTPVFALAYQGKFEGLYAHFGLKDMFITHQDLKSDTAVIDFLLSAVARRAEVRADIARELPRVKALARRNLEI
jgi:colanic acid/amylovoran biosynthesis protein